MNYYKIAGYVADIRPLLPSIAYHGGNWKDHKGGMNGLKPSDPSIHTSWGYFDKVINLTSSIQDAEDWMYSITQEGSEPGIIYEINVDLLDIDKLRPNDLMLQESGFEEPENYTKDDIERAVIETLSLPGDPKVFSYEGTIDKEIQYVYLYKESSDSIKLRYKSPEHLEFVKKMKTGFKV